MADHPIRDVIEVGVQVPKEAFSVYVEGRTELVLTSAAEIQSLVLPDTLVVSLFGVNFLYDSTDTTSAHDGVTVLVDATPTTARRYKRVGVVIGAAEALATDAVVQAFSTTAIKTTIATYAGDLDSLAGSVDKFSVLRVATGATNTPSGAAVNGSHVVTNVWDTNAARQTFLEFNAIRVWTRSKASGAWGSWNRLLSQDDTASVADVRAASAATATDAQILTAPLLESASAYVELDDAATIAIDWDTGINFYVEVAGNRTLGNPTNGQPGTWRTVYMNGDDATDRTLTFDTQYSGELPVITDLDIGRHYMLTIFCAATNQFIVSAKRALG